MSPCRIIEIVKISGADDISNGTVLKVNLPCGVMNVVSSFDSSSNGNCQKPLLDSSFEKTDVFLSFAKLSSTDDIGCISHLTRFVEMGKVNTNHHPVVCLRHNNHSGAPISWLCHFGDDPCCSILRSSSSTLRSNGCGTLRGAYKHIGRASSRRLIWCCIFSFPRPWNNGKTLCTATSSTMSLVKFSCSHASLILDHVQRIRACFTAVL